MVQLKGEGKGREGQTSGCALMIAILRVRCGSSVYVQKKSCSLTSRGGAVSASGELRNRATFASLGMGDVVTMEVEAGILNDWYACVSRGILVVEEKWFEVHRLFLAWWRFCFSGYAILRGPRAAQSAGLPPQRVLR
jgi:hypothetical protein